MRKSFSCAIYCILLLIALYFYDSWTFLYILIFVFLVVYALIQLDLSERTQIKKPGTVSHSKCYITSYKVTKSLDNNYSSKLGCLKRNINPNDSEFLFKKPLTQKTLPVKSNSSVTKYCQADMSFLKSDSSPSIGLNDYSPVRRRPLHSRNRIDNEDSSCVSPTVVSPVRDVASGDGGMLTPRRSTLTSDSGSPNDNMSIGEFPLISLVSSLHEAVSPKTPKLKPSPVTIRIQPIHSPELLNESRVDPVVSVLKQLSSKKRILGPSSSTLIEDEQREKKARSMPRHDLTHSLLESQLTINSNRETVNSKREREESYCPVSSPNGTSSGTAPKRMCARTLRSNEILSSLSSSVTLTSPVANKSYTGKRKTVSFDKYKKMRRLEESTKKVSPDDLSPSKIDKAVSAEERIQENKSAPLPVITIKRDEISERVVSRAMVSALLKSTVAKLIMSGDPAVYPVPNGTQPRQPEVTAPEFGPPVTAATEKSSAQLSSNILLAVTSNSSPSFLFNLPKATTTTATLPAATTSLQQPPSFNLGQQTSGATSPTSQTLTSSVQSPSSTAGSNVQTSFSITKPQMSVSSVPSFGKGISTTSLITPTTSSTLQFGISTSGSSVPSFGLPSTAPSTTSIATPSFSTPSILTSTIKTPTFGLIPPSSDIPAKTSAPTFGLTSNSSVTTTSSVPSFSFVNPIVSKTPVMSIPTPPFSSNVVTTTAPSSFTLNTSTIATPATNMFISKPTLFVSTASTTSTPTTGSSMFSLPGIQTPVTVPNTTLSALAPSLPTSKPVFGSNTTTTTSSNPIFGGSKPLFGTTTSTTPIFGSTISTPTSSSNVFGSIQPTTAIPIFSATNKAITTAPMFGSNTVTTTTSASVFGGFTSVNPVTASSSIFGGNITANTPAPIFGGVSTTAPNPLFGLNTSTTSTASPTPFGTNVNTSAPVFGGSLTTATTSAPLFGASTSATSSTAPLFGATTATTVTPTPIFGGSSTSFSGSSGFGGSSTGKPSEGLFGMPSSNSGFKPTTLPFQVSTGDAGSTVPAFGASSQQPKPFDFGSTKPASGGFTFKAGGAAPTPFSTQPAPATNTTFTPQPATQAPFSFTSSAPPAPSSQPAPSPFIFGSGTAPSNTASASSGKPFQFGNSSAISPTPQAFGGVGSSTTAQPTFGQSFTPTFGQTTAAFGQTPSSPAPNNAFQFSATQPPTPGTTGGLFSIGTGSSTTRQRDRRDRRRR